MAHILVIAPSSGLKELFIEASLKLQQEITVEIGKEQEGLTIAQQQEKNGYDVIISHGATARLLHQHCRLPVVEVHTSGYDMIRTLTLLQGFPGKIGILGSDSILQGAETIGTLLAMPLAFFPVEQEEERLPVVQQAASQGIQAIVSDIIGQAEAASYGVHVLAIIPGQEAVISALKEAKRLGAAISRTKQQHMLLTGILSEYEDAIVAVNDKEVIQLVNKKAESLLNIEAEQVMENLASEMHPLLRFADMIKAQSSPIEEIHSVAGQNMLVKKRLLYLDGKPIGAVAICKEMSRLRQLENRMSHLSFTPQQSRVHFPHLIATTEEMGETIETARLFSKHDTPILVYGEKGTGKQSLAEAIHNESSRREGPFLVLDCMAIDEGMAEELFEEAGEEGTNIFTLAKGGTLYLQDVGSMPLVLQDRLIHLLQRCYSMEQIDHLQSSASSPRLIAAHFCDLKSEVEAGRFREELYRLLHGGVLRLPPLRERKQDIPELIRWFIVSFNMQEGKQIVGVRPEVTARLKEAPWPENIRQLKDVTEKLCRAATGLFIEGEEAEATIQELFTVPEPTERRKPEPSELRVEERVHKEERKQMLPSENVGSGIDITGKTLEELEVEIILRVLKEENNNQSQAAKRLGINRTTLWRKIKE